MATTFNVTMAVEDMEGKTGLVFLKPLPAQRNYLIHAWQVLTGSAGSTESFEYRYRMSTDVTSLGVNPANTITSGNQELGPGDLYEAVSPNGLSPKLQLAPTSDADERLTPQQAGVINRTTPFIQFDVNWYVNQKPVVTCPKVDKNMTCSFEFMPHFYFMVAAPPLIGQTYIVQNFSDMTKYVLPITATSVDVRLTKEQGLWLFNFKANE